MSTDHSTVYVVDDDPAIRDSMIMMLDAAGFTAEAYPSAATFLAAFDLTRAGCLVLDVCMPGMNGLDLFEQIRTKHPDVPVIIVTGHGDVAKTRRSFKLGAVDFIEKPFSSRQLVALIRETIDTSATVRQRNAHHAQIMARVALLSAREREVMDLVTTGLLNKQMAAKLGVHVRTIEFHRKNIMRKMQVQSVPELVEMTLTSRTDHAFV